MRELSTKILIGVLCVTLVVPTVFFMRPQKAEAALLSVAQCFAARMAEKAKAAGEAAAAAALAVSTSDWIGSQQTAEAGSGTNWSACFMKAMAKLIGKTILHTFTQSIVNWINTGFKGSPSFVTNPEGFLNDIADQTIGQVIEGISPLLCSPFKLDIRLSLGLNMSLNTKEDIHCRLSDVMANVRRAYDGFVQGTVGSGNLNQWIHIAGTPQNNPYGAYIATTNKLGLGITTATGEQIKLLDWGDGFKSWRPCKVPGDPIEVKDKKGDPIKVNGVVKTREGPCKEYGPIQTPGSIIQSSATGALGTTFRELELASEIDEVVGALINQLMVKAMTGLGGLLGASKGDVTNDGQSYVDSLLTDPTKAVSASDAKVPDGIDCGLSYYPTTVESSKDSKIYVADEKVHQVWTANLGKNLADKRPLVEATYPYVNGTTPLLITKPLKQSWADYLAGIKKGCLNDTRFITNTSAKSLGGYSSGSVTPGSEGKQSVPVKPESVEANLAINKRSAQSSVHVDSYRSYTAEAGNDGTSQSGMITARESVPWWRVDIGRDKQNIAYEINEVREVVINRVSWYNQGSSLFLYVSNTPFETLLPDGVTLSALATLSECEKPILSHKVRCYKIPDVVPPAQGTFEQVSLFQPAQLGETGRYWMIVKDNSGREKGELHLSLSEVTIYGKQTRLDSTGSGGKTVTPARFSFADITPLTFKKDAQGNGWTPGNVFGWNGIAFTPNKIEGGITFRATYFECPSLPSLNSPIPDACPERTNATHEVKNKEFRSNFSSLGITYSIDGATITKEMIANSGNGYGYTAAAEVAPNAPETGISFAKDVNLRNTNIIQISLNGSPRANMPFRVIIEAVDNTGVVVGSARADFVR